MSPVPILVRALLISLSAVTIGNAVCIPARVLVEDTAVAATAPWTIAHFLRANAGESGTLLSQADQCARQLDSAPLLSIDGSDADAQQLYHVSGGLIFPDGRVALTSSGTHSVMLFGADGRHVRSFGRKGEGPQEFRTLAGLWRVSDSLILVADPSKSRVSFLTNDLRFAERAQLATGSHVRWPAVVGVAGGSVLAINGQAFEAGQLGVGVVRPPFEFIRFERNGTLVDTVLTMPGREFFIPAPERSASTQAIPFGRSVLYAIGRNALITLDTDVATLRFLDLTRGDTREVVLPLTRSDVTRGDIERYKAQRHTTATSPSQKRLARELDNIPFPRRFPVADRMLVGQDGSVWIREFRVSDVGVATWLIFSPDRGEICTMHLPAALELLDATRDRVLVLSADSDGLESIFLHRYDSGAGQGDALETARRLSAIRIADRRPRMR